MIIIDGRRSSMEISSFANLEEILVKVMEDELGGTQIVTDVFVNEEAFSEIYPHHAEDMETGDITSIEVRTVSAGEMAKDVNHELFTVIKIMQNGSKGVAASLRKADTAEGLEVLQDLLDVTRHFLGTISALHISFPMNDTQALTQVSGTLDALLSEMAEAMADQDWLLLADLLEYEFHPACAEWESVLDDFSKGLAAARVE